MSALKSVFIPDSELSHDLKICRSNKGNWYSANTWHRAHSDETDSGIAVGTPGIQMSEPEILSNLSVALTEVDEIMTDLKAAQNRVTQLRKFAARLYASNPLKVVSDV